MSQLSLDARTILNHLNDLGYRNITAEQLKEFMKDLRKLIKYEDRIGARNENIGTIDEKSNNLYEKLHKTTTASYRAKLPENIKPTKYDKTQCQRRKENIPLRPTTTKNQIHHKRKSDDCQNKKTKIDNSPNRDEQNIVSCRSTKLITPSTERTSNKMWIRPKSVASQTYFPNAKCPKKGDAVQLYQYYKSEWNKFKPNLPGENSHAGLRWKIRNKMMGV